MITGLLAASAVSLGFFAGLPAAGTDPAAEDSGLPTDVRTLKAASDGEGAGGAFTLDGGRAWPGLSFGGADEGWDEGWDGRWTVRAARDGANFTESGDAAAVRPAMSERRGSGADLRPEDEPGVSPVWRDLRGSVGAPDGEDAFRALLPGWAVTGAIGDVLEEAGLAGTADGTAGLSRLPAFIGRFVGEDTLHR